MPAVPTLISCVAWLSRSSRPGRAPNAHQIISSVHGHTALVLAVATSLAAVRAGARQVECTVNGLGERAGNASLEEIVVALAVRQASFGARTNVCLEKIYPTSRLLSEITGVAVPPNKAGVRANAL